MTLIRQQDILWYVEASVHNTKENFNLMTIYFVFYQLATIADILGDFFINVSSVFLFYFKNLLHAEQRIGPAIRVLHNINTIPVKTFDSVG